MPHRSAAVRARGRPPGRVRPPEGAGAARHDPPPRPLRGDRRRRAAGAREGSRRPLLDLPRADRRGRCGARGDAAGDLALEPPDGPRHPDIHDHRRPRLHALHGGARRRGRRGARLDVRRDRPAGSGAARGEADRAAWRRGPGRLRLRAPGASVGARDPGRRRGGEAAAGRRRRARRRRGGARRRRLPRRRAQPRRTPLLARRAGRGARERDRAAARARRGRDPLRRASPRAREGSREAGHGRRGAPGRPARAPVGPEAAPAGDIPRPPPPQREARRGARGDRRGRRRRPPRPRRVRGGRPDQAGVDRLPLAVGQGAGADRRQRLRLSRLARADALVRQRRRQDRRADRPAHPQGRPPVRQHPERDCGDGRRPRSRVGRRREGAQAAARRPSLPDHRADRPPGEEGRYRLHGADRGGRRRGLGLGGRGEQGLPCRPEDAPGHALHRGPPGRPARVRRRRPLGRAEQPLLDQRDRPRRQPGREDGQAPQLRQRDRRRRRLRVGDRRAGRHAVEDRRERDRREDTRRRPRGGRRGLLRRSGLGRRERPDPARRSAHGRGHAVFRRRPAPGADTG